MDRGKSASGSRGPKAKITQQPPDLFIALGAKQSSPRDDPKRSVPLPKTTTSHLQASSSKVSTKLKREGTSSSLPVPPSKKLKVNLPGTSRPSNVPGIFPGDRIVSVQTGGIEAWEALAVECESTELFENIVSNSNNGTPEKAVNYILGAIKSIRSQRFKVCKITYSSLLLACGCSPTLFTNDNVVAGFVSILRREIAASLKAPTKSNSHIPMLFANVLNYAFSDVALWPELFVKIYIEDAVGERVWIDNPYCKPFVDNIVTAFNTKLPPKSLLVCETWSSTVRETSSPLTINTVEDDEALNEHKSIVDQWNTKVAPRFAQVQPIVEQFALEAIREQVTRRSQPETVTKNFVRFLSVACGLVEIRMIAVARIETWLHNHKLMKPAQELLAYLCHNCSASSQRDIEVIAQLSKLRLKNKPMVNFFNNCLREMVYSIPENLFPLLKCTVYNELSNSRNANNLIVIGALFQVAPEAAADAFADLCLELLLNKDDYLRSLRALLKEINRVLRHEFNVLNVVHALVRDRKEFSATARDSEFRERIFFAIADLVCVCMLLCVSPQVREAASQNKRDVVVLKTFQAQVSNIQREGVTWLHDNATKTFRPNPQDFKHVLLKILFLEQAEHYYKVDNWPGENERNLFLRLASEVSLLQGTLIRVLLIGLSKEHMLLPNDAIEIAEQLIRRAANLTVDCGPPLVVDKLEIFDIYFNLASYNHPENITLPAGYVPPNLAISALYWRVWLTLLIMAAHNPKTIGSVAWTKYPTLGMFMEMCITNHFSFPPPTIVSCEDDYQSHEQQTLILEKQKILEFETHLAAASTKAEINEQTSLLLPQLMELRPDGEARRPPAAVLEQLQTLNATHRMGHLLCRSRNPDFLLDIMSRQGGTAHMPWLAELVHSSEGALAHLPVQCLCEYLLSTAPAEKLTKHGQLLAHLRTVVNGNDPQMACEVLEYLFRRLTSAHGASRTQATKGLILILSPTEDPDINTDKIPWLTQFIFHFPHFAVIKPALVQFLRQALLIETNPDRVSAYINFLSTPDCSESFGDLHELISDLSSVIIERHSVASYVLSGEDNPTLRNLLSIFYLHLQKSKEFSDDTYALLQGYNSADYVIASWPGGGEQCAMQTLAIHAAIVLLTYGPIDNCDAFDSLLRAWFPTKIADQPRAFTPDTTESTTYLLDWIKLRMIRSNVSRLVDAAIEKLEPQKLILFIQSFGIPTASISKLLSTLDRTTLINPKLVVDSVLDKAYMIQLVEVQNKRGAVGGDTFVKAIEMHVPLAEDDDVDIGAVVKKQLPIATSINRKIVMTDAEIVKLLNNLFDPKYFGDKNKIITQLIKEIPVGATALDTCFYVMRSRQPHYITAPLPEYPAISTLLHLIFGSTVTEERIVAATRLLNAIADKNCSAATVLSRFLKKRNKSRSGDTIQGASIKMETEIKIEEGDSSENEGQLIKMLWESQTEKTGELIDLFSTMELEIASSNNRKLQMDMLFSKQNLPYRPLLMSLLLQRASWQGLYGIMRLLFESNPSETCPVSALDFLTALTRSPKLWQGRDKAIPKHYHFEDVLQLTKEQIQSLVEYILEEAKSSHDEWEKKMERRMELLLKCVGVHASSIVRTLLDRPNKAEDRSQELLLMIYMSLPAAGQDLVQPKDEATSKVYVKTCPSAIDEVAHTLLSALAATPRTKDWSRKSLDLELCARKLASTHPVLVLRQLPLLAGSLKGRAQYEWNVLKGRGHLLLFRQIFGLVELLQPGIFERTSSLREILDSYFLLLQYHGHSKELATLVNRLVAFIQDWMLKDIKAASKYLQERGSVIIDLQIVQPGVRPLLSSVSLPSNDQNSPADFLVGTLTPRIIEPLPSNWPQIVTGLKNTDNLSALQELEHVTSKKPELLRNVASYLFNSLSSSNGAVRTLALTLSIKWMKFNPKAASDALPHILTCLDSKNGDTVETILDKLSELVSVMQEYAKLILTRVFQLGMKSTLNTTSNIGESIYLLSLQSGC